MYFRSRALHGPVPAGRPGPGPVHALGIVHVCRAGARLWFVPLSTWNAEQLNDKGTPRALTLFLGRPGFGKRHASDLVRLGSCLRSGSPAGPGPEPGPETYVSAVLYSRGYLLSLRTRAIFPSYGSWTQGWSKWKPISAPLVLSIRVCNAGDNAEFNCCETNNEKPLNVSEEPRTQIKCT